jgi:hypothetical protein
MPICENLKKSKISIENGEFLFIREFLGQLGKFSGKRTKGRKIIRTFMSKITSHRILYLK